MSLEKLKEIARNSTLEKFVSFRNKGLDACGRPIPIWEDVLVFHSTSESGAQAIRKKGWHIAPGTKQFGYYGKAISFTPDREYTREFGPMLTISRIKPGANILNLNDPADWETWQKAQKEYSGHPGEYHKMAQKHGIQGVYDPGAGDLFVYNPKIVDLVAVVSNDIFKDLRSFYETVSALQNGAEPVL
jgi:hypothetical protein